MTEAQRRALEHLTLHNPYIQSYQAPDGTVHVDVYTHALDSSRVRYDAEANPGGVLADAAGAALKLVVDDDGQITDRAPKPKRRARK